MWYFLDTGENNGAWNMALDEALCQEAEKDPEFLVIRLYGWKPWCVSIGYSQKADHEVNFAALRESGFDFVRRATGGRAVLHANELTYSVIANPACKRIGFDLHETYVIIGNAILAGLSEAGFAGISLARSKMHESGAKVSAHPCFSSTARSEIVWNGRKLVGSAQKRTYGAVLQHGSIPLGPEYRNLAGLLNLEPATAEMRQQEMLARSACLAEIGNPPAYDALVSSMIRGFAGILGTSGEPYAIPEPVAEHARNLVQEKYSSECWNRKF